MTLYQRMKAHKNKPEFWIMLGFAAVIIGLSFGQTKEFVAKAGATNIFHQIGFAVGIEILFGFTLLTRANQRAQRKNVPLFLNIAYIGLLGAITFINMSVLYEIHPVAGPFLGALITGTMVYVESLFVWLNTDADQPSRKTPKQLMREAKREIREEEIIQLVEYLKFEARKPSLNLIKRARRDERKRKRIESGESIFPWVKSEDEGLPEYFRRKPEPTPEIEAEPVEPVIVQEPGPGPGSEQEKHTAEVVPIKRPIGFHVEMSNTETPEPATIEHPSNTPKSNTQKRQTSNTKKHQSLTKKEQAIQYVIGLIERDEDYSVTSVANTVGCARSTASVAIREAREKLAK